MNGQSSPAFEDKKPSLHLAGSSISATKHSPSLLETSSADMGFYSGQGAHSSPQDFFQQQHQQTYSAQHMNPYAYHHYNLNGLGPGGAYSVGKAEYPYPHAGYREPGAFSREVQSALQDDGKSSGSDSFRLEINFAAFRTRRAIAREDPRTTRSVVQCQVLRCGYLEAGNAHDFLCTREKSMVVSSLCPKFEV